LLTLVDADHPALLAMSLGLILNEPVASMVILLMLTGGEALEEYAVNRAESEIYALLEEEPGVARRIIAGTDSVEEVIATDLVQGDTLVLRNGDSAPVDCAVAGSRTELPTPAGGGNSPRSFLVDESMVTGETVAQKKRAGDTILGGSISLSPQPLTVHVLKSYSESTMALFKSSLAAALDRKSKLERSSIKLAADFTPFTLLLCAFSFWWQQLRGISPTPLQLWGRVLAVLMAATPCPAAIGVPVAMLCGISISSKRGISIKSGAALENIGKATVCVLDKTGTLTRGEPAVRSIDFLGTPAIDKDEVLRLCGSLEQSSNHPLAVAVIKHAQEKGVKMCPVNDVIVHENKVGGGLEGTVDGCRVRIGTADFVWSPGQERGGAT
jgi:P-type E1-E2 ATPase